MKLVMHLPPFFDAHFEFFLAKMMFLPKNKQELIVEHWYHVKDATWICDASDFETWKLNPCQ